MVADSQAFHVLEDEGPGLEFGDDANEIEDKAIARIVQDPLPDQGETLARRTAEDAINGTISDPCGKPDFGTRQPFDRTRDDGGCREVEFVDGTMNGVNFDCRHNIKA